MTTNNEKKDPAMSPLGSVAELVEIAGRTPASTVIIPGGSRIEDLRLVEAARDHGIVNRVILVGRSALIHQAVDECGISIDPCDIVYADTDEEIARTTVTRIQEGDVDIVLKGNISTPILNRHMLALAQRPTVTLASIFDADTISAGRPILLTDAGITTVCSFGRMIDMIHNAVDIARTVMGLDCPRVAVLSANEKQIPSLGSTWMGLELAKLKWSDCVVCGPLSFDLATSPDSVSVKGMPDLPGAETVAGQADILVCPGIDSANILYKAISAMAKYGEASIAGITVGFSIPYVILSRSDTLDTRLESIALCSIYRQRSSLISESRGPVAEAPSQTKHRLLTVNPGSTSMKVAVFDNDQCIDHFEIPLAPCASEPLPYRQAAIQDVTRQICNQLKEKELADFTAVSARGGFLPRPETKLPVGTYLLAHVHQGRVTVAQDILIGSLNCPEQAHMSNLGAPMAAQLADHFKIPAYIVDPVVADEFEPLAEISGYQGITRKSTAHVLSIRMAARKAAKAARRPLDDMNLVIAHLGGGITVATVKQGKITDNSIALLGEGPFSPCRAGQLPQKELIDLCYSGRFTREELMRELTLNGGVQSYLGEHDMAAVENRIHAGDEQARLIVDAMVYQIAKQIGAAFTAAECRAECIVLTGGMTRSSLIRNSLRKRVGRLAPILVYPEDLEMEALAQGAMEVLCGRVKPHQYKLNNIT
ncbi:MAG: butyrate kinase [Phycisphaerae bacterium]|nr:butyrate kinase [Phycisphaerae bacterium]